MLKHEMVIISAEVERPITDEKEGITWITKLVEKIGMEFFVPPIAKYSHMDGNRGLTISAIITTSHIACHIWDETNPAKVELDVYSCSTLDVNAVLDCLEEMAPSKVMYKFIDRENGLNELYSNRIIKS
ncbi:MAG: S-adenosylmethionine decarboxylase [Candidimonas sp.]